MLDCSILVRCYEWSDYTSKTINSILSTARSNYTLTMHPNKASAPVNSNLLIDCSQSEYIILMDDDLEFTSTGWDIALLNTLINYPQIGLLAPRLFDHNMKPINAQSLAPRDKISTGYKTAGALFAFKESGIRYDEGYSVTQYDDTDLAYQYIKNKKLVAIHGGVDVKHMKPVTSGSRPWVSLNRKLFFKKWKCNDESMWGKKRVL